MTAAAWVWARVPAPPGAPAAPGAERGEEFGKTSPIALVVILLLGLATALLVRSMNKRLRNVPESFDIPRSDARSGDEAGPGGVDGPGRTASSVTDRTEGPPRAGSP